MKVRTVLMVLAILAVIAFLFFGTGGLPFGRDARTASVRNREDLAVNPSKSAPSEVSMSPMPTVAIPPHHETDSSLDGFADSVRHRIPSQIARRALKFADGSVELAPAEIAKLEEVAALQSTVKVQSFVIVAHGSLLSDATRARIENVRRRLIENGARESSITAMGDESTPSDTIQVVVIAYREQSDRRRARAAPRQ